jgi:hypothetical protein
VEGVVVVILLLYGSIIRNMKPNPNLVDDELHQILTCVDMIQHSKDNLKLGNEPLYCLVGVMDWVTELQRLWKGIKSGRA